MDAGRMHALACQYARARTEEALEAAYLAAEPLCVLVARRFSGRGIEYEDLYQAASLACVTALKRFDPALGLKFTTYVTPMVTGTVRNFIRDKASPLHAARTVREDAAAFAAARERYLAAHHEEPAPRELAEMLSWPLERVIRVALARASARPLSLDAADEEGASLAERLPSLESGFEKIERREDLKRALAALSEKERLLLACRYEGRMSQRETAARMGLTQMQVSRMERRILAALKSGMEGSL